MCLLYALCVRSPFDFLTSSSQALQLAVYLAFQFRLPPFSAVPGQCLPVFIPITFKSSSTSSLHPLRGFPLFLVPFMVEMQLVLHSFSMTIPSYSEGFYKFYCIFPCNILILQRSPAFTGPRIFRTILHSNILTGFVSFLVITS